jgi:hypothetical protein
VGKREGSSAGSFAAFVRISWIWNVRLLPETDTHSQFWLLHEDSDQPGNTLFCSVQCIGWRNIGDARIILDGCPLPTVLNVPSKFFEPIAAVWSRKDINASVVLGIFNANENRP